MAVCRLAARWPKQALSGWVVGEVFCLLPELEELRVMGLAIELPVLRELVKGSLKEKGNHRV